MSFAAPLWLVAGAVVLAVLVLALRGADAGRRRDLERFASPQLLGDLTATASPGRRRVKRALVLSAVALAFFSLAGPEVGFRWEETRRRGVDVLIAVDVSRSMLARDVQPNRLKRAKLAVDDLVARLGGDRVGLIAFAGTAFLQCPLTLDHGAFHDSLEALEPGIIPAPGSDLGSAITIAENALESEGKNVKLLVLLSDGEDLRGDALAAAEQAAKAGVKIFTVGVGTPAGELIPVPGEDGASTFVKDAEGRIVKSRLDEKTLRRIAEVTGGFYVPLGRRGEGIQEIALRAIEPIPRADLASRLRRVPENRYQWPLAAALLLLVIEPFIGERRREQRGRRAVPTEAEAAAAAAVVLLGVLAGARPSRAESADEAARLYERKSYAEAASAYRNAAEKEDDPRLEYNQGAAAYRAGAFADAAGAFAKALRTEDEMLRERAFYDFGNAQFRAGEQKVETNPDQTMTAWKQAIDSYDAALRLDEKDADAKYNKELVQRRLEELQKQQQQQNQQEQNDQRQDQKEDQQQSKDQQQSQQDDQQKEQRPQDGKSDQNEPDPAPSPEKPEESEPQGQPQQKPRDEKKSPEQQNASGKPDEKPGPRPDPSEAGEPPQEAKIPGRMSPSEARELLDSLRGDEEAMPLLPMAKTKQADEAENPRNW